MTLLWAQRQISKGISPKRRPPSVQTPKAKHSSIKSVAKLSALHLLHRQRTPLHTLHVLRLRLRLRLSFMRPTILPPSTPPILVKIRKAPLPPQPTILPINRLPTISLHPPATRRLTPPSDLPLHLLPLQDRTPTAASRPIPRPPPQRVIRLCVAPPPPALLRRSVRCGRCGALHRRRRRRPMVLAVMVSVSTARRAVVAA